MENNNKQKGVKRYIYNMAQANYFLSRGCKAIGAGVSKNEHTYIVFEYNELFEEAFIQWKYKQTVVE